MDLLSPDNTFILICPKCKMLAFDPKNCVNCGAEIPSSTRIKIVNRHNRVYEITGYHLNNFSKSTYAHLNETPSSGLIHKAAIWQKSDTETDSRFNHDENCACVKYLKTEEEVKKSLLRIGGNEVTEESHQHTAEEHHNTNSVSASSNLVHPAGGCVTIWDKDMECLANGKRLNDNIIDSYLNYVYHKIIPHEFQVLTHIFSACFNAFLMMYFGKKNKSKNRLDREQRVKKWVKNVDLFSKDFIFVPINRRKHWYLAVICFIAQLNKNSDESEEPPKTDFSEDNSPDERKKDHPYLKKGMPCICFFDSFDTNTSLDDEKIEVAGTLKEILKMLWNDKNPKEPYDWENLPCLKAVCPQQDKGSKDCGLYLLQYVESFFQNPIAYFENQMPVLKEWFPKSIMVNKRKEIKKALSELEIKRPQNAPCSSDVIVLKEIKDGQEVAP